MFAISAPLYAERADMLPTLPDRLLFAACWIGIGGFGLVCWWSLLKLVQGAL